MAKVSRPKVGLKQRLVSSLIITFHEIVFSSIEGLQNRYQLFCALHFPLFLAVVGGNFILKNVCFLLCYLKSPGVVSIRLLVSKSALTICKGKQNPHDSVIS